MKTQPNDVVVGASYKLDGSMVTVTAIRPKGRGFYVEYERQLITGTWTGRLPLEYFRRACATNQREIA